MATTVTSAFSEFKSRLEITGLQAETVSTRQQVIRRTVASQLDVLDSFLIGSYRRHTMIAPLNQADVDVFIVLDPKHYDQSGQAATLDKVRQALLTRYPKTPRIKRNGQAVTVTFTDFTVDVVPGFYRRGGGYLIPNTYEKRWIPTDPSVHDTRISSANKAHEGNLVPLIKMIKAWNREQSGAFSSFYLELMVARLLNNVLVSDYPSGCRYIFDKARTAVRYVEPDPANYGSNVNGLDGVQNVNAAVQLVTEAYGAAMSAERVAVAIGARDAIQIWRSLFGDRFPTFG